MAEAVKRTTKILKCETCVPHDYQDTRYGWKMRVHNRCKPEAKENVQYRCTVCRSVRSK